MYRKSAHPLRKHRAIPPSISSLFKSKEVYIDIFIKNTPAPSRWNKREVWFLRQKRRGQNQVCSGASSLKGWQSCMSWFGIHPLRPLTGGTLQNDNNKEKLRCALQLLLLPNRKLISYDKMVMSTNSPAQWCGILRDVIEFVIHYDEDAHTHQSAANANCS